MNFWCFSEALIWEYIENNPLCMNEAEAERVFEEDTRKKDTSAKPGKGV